MSFFEKKVKASQFFYNKQFFFLQFNLFPWQQSTRVLIVMQWRFVECLLARERKRGVNQDQPSKKFFCQYRVKCQTNQSRPLSRFHWQLKTDQQHSLINLLSARLSKKLAFNTLKHHVMLNLFINYFHKSHFDNFMAIL